MIRLTVLYNLPEGSSEDEFLRWRLGEHQTNNASMPGVVYTDFAKIEATWPGTQDSPYTFMTIADFSSKQVFEDMFYSDRAQSKLQEDIKRIKDPLFLISEILIQTDKRDN